MRRRSGLDALIGRFRERWETDPRYRAAMSGVIGLVVVVSMCACMAAVSVVANNLLAGGGFTSGTGGQQTGGNGVVQAAPSFPTPTEPSWQVPATPVWSPVPDSQTPSPAPPTATPTNTPTASSGLSWSADPTPWTYCPGGNTCDNVNVQTQSGYQLVVITINYPSDPTPIPGSITTDASGAGTFSFAGPHGTGKATITLVYGTQTFTFKHTCSG